MAKRCRLTHPFHDTTLPTLKSPFHDVLAGLFEFETMREMYKNLKHERSELRGMKMERFIGDDIVVQKGMKQEKYNRAGYRFTFRDDVDLCFDVST